MKNGGGASLTSLSSNRALRKVDIQYGKTRLDNLWNAAPVRSTNQTRPKAVRAAQLKKAKTG